MVAGLYGLKSGHGEGQGGQGAALNLGQDFCPLPPGTKVLTSQR